MTLTEQDQFKLKKYDYIPINPKLIEHVRRLDGFNVSYATIINFMHPRFLFYYIEY